MSTRSAVSGPQLRSPSTGSRRLVKSGQRVRRAFLPLFAACVFVYMLIPIAVIILFSFNKPEGRFNFVWHRFSLDGWLNPLAVPNLAEALKNSVSVALCSSVIATILGTLLALGLTRRKFKGRSAINTLIILPIATPEIVIGSGLLALFVASATVEPFSSIIPGGTLFPLGFHTVLLAHVVYTLSFVVVTVRSRLQGYDNTLEEAAADLGANPWTVFWQVTLPAVLPGVGAGGALAFAISIDDFVVTQFTSGQAVFFPTWIYGLLRNQLPVQVNVVGSIIFLVSISLAVLPLLWTFRAEARTRRNLRGTPASHDLDDDNVR